MQSKGEVAFVDLLSHEPIDYVCRRQTINLEKLPHTNKEIKK